MLADHLQALGHEVVLTREPGATALGKELRRLLLTWESSEPVAPEAEMIMFAADRAQHVAQVIRPALNAGKVVITDRYIDSTFAYQGYGRGLDLERLKSLQEIATEGLIPQVTIWVDVSVDTSRIRRGVMKNDRIESESDAMYEKVCAGYAALQKIHSDRIVHVNGEKSIQEVFQDILQTVLPRI